MTRKHYQWMADYIRRARKAGTDPDVIAHLLCFAIDMSRKFGQNFDEQRFHAATLENKP